MKFRRGWVGFVTGLDNTCMNNEFIVSEREVVSKCT